VLVVGAGGAGLRAAIAAADAGADVLLLTKGELGRSGTTATACSDRMAFHATLAHTEPGGEGAWWYHADDIYRIGGRVSDGDLAAVLARNAAEAFDYLAGLGVPWAMDGAGRADQFVTDGSEYARACYTGPHTANHIEEALVGRVRRTPVRVVENCMAVDLILSRDGGAVVGAVAMPEASDGSVVDIISASAVVLATGGPGLIFANHVYPEGMTGDGTAMALRAGAELVNMEFIQIGLCSTRTKLACSGSLMRAVPRFVSGDGREFLGAYLGADPAAAGDLVFEKGASWPVSSEAPTSAIDVAVSREMVGGVRVFLDYSSNPEGLSFGMLSEANRTRYFAEASGGEAGEGRESSPLARLMELNEPCVRWFAERGIDVPGGDRIEIAPSAQHFQGGVRIRTGADCTLRGLYACGECAGGQHGANRPGGNALLDSQVFGRIAGESAAAFAVSVPRGELLRNRIESIAVAIAETVESRGGVPAAEARGLIQSAVGGYCSVVRTSRGLRRAARELARLRKRGIAMDAHGTAYALETRNLLEVAEAVAMAASMRRESRGPHLHFGRAGEGLRPLPSSAKWECYIVLCRRSGRLTARRAVPQPLPAPAGLEEEPSAQQV